MVAFAIKMLTLAKLIILLLINNLKCVCLCVIVLFACGLVGVLYVPGAARGVLFGGYMQYSPANAVGCSQDYHPLEPEMLLFCCCFYLRCFLIVLKDFIMLLCAL